MIPKVSLSSIIWTIEVGTYLLLVIDKNARKFVEGRNRKEETKIDKI